jgi:hypothetical protein
MILINNYKNIPFSNKQKIWSKNYFLRPTVKDGIWLNFRPLKYGYFIEKSTV